MSKVVFCTTAEALKEISKRRGLRRVGYAVFVRPFLSIRGSALGYEGCAVAHVTRKEFERVIKDLLANYEKAGALIQLTIPTEDYESFYL